MVPDILFILKRCSNVVLLYLILVSNPGVFGFLGFRRLECNIHLYPRRNRRTPAYLDFSNFQTYGESQLTGVQPPFLRDMIFKYSTIFFLRSTSISLLDCIFSHNTSLISLLGCVCEDGKFDLFHLCSIIAKHLMGMLFYLTLSYRISKIT